MVTKAELDRIDEATGKPVGWVRLNKAISAIDDTKPQTIWTVATSWIWAHNFMMTAIAAPEIVALKDYIDKAIILASINKLRHGDERDVSVKISVDGETSERQLRGLTVLQSLLILKPSAIPVDVRHAQIVDIIEQDHFDITGLSILYLLNKHGGETLWSNFMHGQPDAMRRTVLKIHEASQLDFFHGPMQFWASPMKAGLANLLLCQMRACDPSGEIAIFIDETIRNGPDRNDAPTTLKRDGMKPVA